MIYPTTARRLPSGQYELCRAAAGVGHAWRFQARYDGTRRPGWGLNLIGIYWRKGDPNTTGGSSSTSTRTLRDAIALADTTLAAITPQAPRPCATPATARATAAPPGAT